METVKKQAFYVKILFFLMFIGFGICMPFSGIFYKHVVVNTDGTPAIGLIGVIFFAMPLVSLIANVPAGILSDKLHLGKHLITFFCFGIALFSALIGLAGEDFAQSWGLAYKFAFIFVMLFLLNCCMQPINPIVDAETLLFLNKYSRRELYGTYRLWGTYGWSISTILMGIILFYFNNISLIFYGTAAAFVVLGFVSLSGLQARPQTEPIKIPWGHLKKDAMFQWFLAFIFLNGIVANASANYTSYFFDDVMKTPFEIGLIFGTWTLFEIPVMLFSRKLIEVLGNRWLIIYGLLLNGVRLVLFSLFTLKTPFLYKWAAALIQGPAFGFAHIGIIDFVDRQAHNDMRATYMSIMNLARVSISSALGGVLGSWMIKQWGAAFLMQFCGYASVVLVLFFVVFVKGHGPRRDIAV